MHGIVPFAGSGPPSGSFTPAQIQEAYQFNQVSYNGSGETIAIVEAYNDPDFQSNLYTFDSEFSIPSTRISVVNQTGGRTLPSADPTGDWEVEESLDVEWAHAMARGERHAGGSQLRQPFQLADGRELCIAACKRRFDELGKQRVLGRDVIRQLL